MAKFKVGDKVELLANPYAGIGNVVEVTPVGTIKAMFPERSGDTVNVFLERDLKLANAARNAIKVGDTVTYKLDAPGNKGKKYIVLEEGRTGYVWLADMDGRGNGMEVERADLTLANSRACNANANYRIGQKVEVHTTTGGELNRPIKITGTISKLDNGYGRIVVDYRDPWGYKQDIHVLPSEITKVLNSRSCNGLRSRNAVVAKALNACARNGGIDDFKVGDRVMVRSVVGFTPTDPKPGTITAIYKSDNRIAVKKDDGGRGLFDASMVTKNACGTARNAGDRDMYEDAIRQAIVKCEAAIKYEPDADDYSDVTRLVKQAKDILAKAYRAI